MFEINKNKQKEAGVGPFLNIFLEKSRGGGGGGLHSGQHACLLLRLFEF